MIPEKAISEVSSLICKPPYIEIAFHVGDAAICQGRTVFAGHPFCAMITTLAHPPNRRRTFGSLNRCSVEKLGLLISIHVFMPFHIFLDEQKKVNVRESTNSKKIHSTFSCLGHKRKYERESQGLRKKWLEISPRR